MATGGVRGDAGPSVLDALARWAEQRPDALAVVDATGPTARTMTWRQLLARSAQVASMLRGLGLGPGDVVAIKAPNCVETIVAALATVQSGAYCCPLLPTLGERETRLLLDHASAAVLLAGPEDAAADLPVGHLVTVDGGATPALDCPSGCPGGHLLSATPLDKPAVALSSGDQGGQLAFTSGTTGAPKRIRHDTATLSLAAAAAAQRLRLTEDDRILVASPLGHHSGFLYGMWLAWLAGCVQIVPGRWNAARGLAALANWRGTVALMVPTLLVDLIAEVNRGAAPPASLRVIVVTGAAVPESLVERATRVLGVTVCRAWGSTETCMGTLGDPADSADLLRRTDGRPLPGVEVRVTDGRGSELPPGTEGQLEVSSRTMFRGYGSEPPYERASFTADGWYRTGDLATVEATGHVRITGRTTDVINRGGEKVPATVIESLLAEHHAVAEAAVVPVGDQRLGERACAFVVLVEGHRLSLAEVQRHLDARGVSKHYWPEELAVVDRLPRNGAGKVQKSALRTLTEGLNVNAR